MPAPPHDSRIECSRSLYNLHKLLGSWIYAKRQFGADALVAHIAFDDICLSFLSHQYMAPGDVKEACRSLAMRARNFLLFRSHRDSRESAIDMRWKNLSIALIGNSS